LAGDETLLMGINIRHYFWKVHG